jgi:GH15 family glucan-1,4-alpha-glucosidase
VTKIEDYAFLSDTHSAALVSRDGSIDWLCLPRFDSPSIFAALLDGERGGYWRIAPSQSVTEVQRRYRGDSFVLETIFTTSTGTICVVDCLALEKRSDPTDVHRVIPEEVLVRVVRGLSGTVPVRMDYRPRFDYGSVVPWFRARHGCIEAVGGPTALDLVASIPLELGEFEISADFEVSEGESVSFLTSYHLSHIERPPRPIEDCADLIGNTESFWSAWARRCTYEGPLREQIIRSLVTLKGLTFSPSGGLVAAATTSLPEQLGGPRNWDYRYCWLRDATFTLDVLLEQGYTLEAEAWRDWLLRAVAGDPEDMQIMYGVLGERRLYEVELDLDGYEASRPVRIGNAAHEQFQLDVYGEVMDSFHSARRAGLSTPEQAWELEKLIVEFVCERWQEPDEGIWEVRSGPQHFVHSKVMAWVAMDRGIKAIENFGLEGPVDHWRDVREEIRREVMDKGVNPARGCFQRGYDDEEMDASLLVLPIVGFIEADDPLMLRTIEAVEEDLLVDGFVLRYRSHETADGLPPGEGTFLMCSFWLVDCLALLGRIEEANQMFERAAGVANDLGLLSEQYDPSDKRLLGNFPQAFSHVALVTSALALTTRAESRTIHRGGK